LNNRSLGECFVIDAGMFPTGTSGVEAGVWQSLPETRLALNSMPLTLVQICCIRSPVANLRFRFMLDLYRIGVRLNILFNYKRRRLITGLNVVFLTYFKWRFTAAVWLRRIIPYVHGQSDPFVSGLYRLDSTDSIDDFLNELIDLA